MLLTTAACILAVDFQVYPRRFSKTETFGYGLMDIGVGSFVFAGGLVSQEARKGAEGSKKRYVKGVPIKSHMFKTKTMFNLPSCIVQYLKIIFLYLQPRLPEEIIT